MPEIIGNMHLHTTTSDGMATHDEVAAAAIRAGLDFIIYTDHNAWVEGLDGWYRRPGDRRELLRLMGQEVNDEGLDPEANHLLGHFAAYDVRAVAARPQQLIDTILERDGLCFLAHPIERPGLKPAEQVYPWISWEVSGYTGIELWNTMTEVKWRLRTLPRAILGAYLPQLYLTGPFPEMLAKWDELLATGRKVVAIGGSDAHGWSFTLGPLTRAVYPYEFLFRTVNTHLFLDEPLAREVDQARAQIYTALKAGHCFISYDLIASSRGFAFTATSGSSQVSMGDTLPWSEPGRLCVNSPQPALLRLLRNGQVIAQGHGRTLDEPLTDPGVYRVEAYRRYWGQQRAWVFTNPIYVTAAA